MREIPPEETAPAAATPAPVRPPTALTALAVALVVLGTLRGLSLWAFAVPGAPPELLLPWFSPELEEAITLAGTLLFWSVLLAGIAWHRHARRARAAAPHPPLERGDQD